MYICIYICIYLYVCILYTSSFIGRIYIYIQQECRSVLVKLHPTTVYRIFFFFFLGGVGGGVRFLGWMPLFIFLGIPVVSCSMHDAVIKWKHFPRYWPFVRGEFPAQRPVTRSFDVFFHLRLNKRLSKQPRGWWFETPPWSLWRQCNDKQSNSRMFVTFGICFKQHFDTIGIWRSAISHLPWCVCPWTFFQNIGFNMVPSDPFMSHLATQPRYSAGVFMLCNWLFLWRLVSWMNHLPPACWSTFWKSTFKQLLGCRFDIMDSVSSFFCILTYALYMTWYIISFFGFIFTS